jgi:hypothetical protein
MLEYDGFRYLCGVIAHPRKYVPELVAAHGARAVSNARAVVLDVGRGCGALQPGEPMNVMFGWQPPSATVSVTRS